jgi:hypothetical protein
VVPLLPPPEKAGAPNFAALVASVLEADKGAEGLAQGGEEVEAGVVVGVEVEAKKEAAPGAEVVIEAAVAPLVVIAQEDFGKVQVEVVQNDC